MFALSTFKEVGATQAWGTGCCCCEGIRSAWETILQPCFNFFVGLPVLVLELEVACRDVALDFFFSQLHVMLGSGVGFQEAWCDIWGCLAGAWSCDRGCLVLLGLARVFEG